jgi:hypothetical protein
VNDTKRHTPGPWRIWTSNSFRRISSDATGHDGDVLHAVVQRDGHPDLHFPNGGFEGPDARLVAAAPDLLEALERCMGALRVVSPGGDADPDVECARAAIAKAIGATS